jgi:hypothetical protein
LALWNAGVGLSVAVRSVLVGLRVKLSDAAERGTTGCFGGANLISADVREGGSGIVVVALVGGNSKTFWEFKVEI